MGWHYLSIPKLQRLHHWSLRMDKFHPTFYNGCDYISMLGFKLIHVDKTGHWWKAWVCPVHFLHQYQLSHVQWYNLVNVLQNAYSRHPIDNFWGQCLRSMIMYATLTMLIQDLTFPVKTVLIYCVTMLIKISKCGRLIDDELPFCDIIS